MIHDSAWIEDLRVAGGGRGLLHNRTARRRRLCRRRFKIAFQYAVSLRAVCWRVEEKDDEEDAR